MEYMSFQGYEDSEFQTKVGAPYTVMINPASMKRDQYITYSTIQSEGSPIPELKYQNTPSYSLSFEITIDCTGVVDPKKTDLLKELKALEKIVYNYNGKIHRPNFVQLLWGKNKAFNSVLSTMDTTYTLFKPDGSPLRAKVSFKFNQYVSEKMMSKIMAKQSPDLTHQVTVIEGDTLPALCNKKWQDPKFYIQVARFNNLNKFRKLEGGQKLIFPPIKQS